MTAAELIIRLRCVTPDESITVKLTYDQAQMWAEILFRRAMNARDRD